MAKILEIDFPVNFVEASFNIGIKKHERKQRRKTAAAFMESKCAYIHELNESATVIRSEKCFRIHFIP
jgi:hypothetical protein